MKSYVTCLLMVLCACAGHVFAAEVSLIDAVNPVEGWRFDNGREFPGAKGGIVADMNVPAQYRPAIRLDSDFSGGGKYVQVGRQVTPVDLEALSFWIKPQDGQSNLALRLIDSSSQCHQFKLRIKPNGEWQRIVFPVAAHFNKVGTSASLEVVQRYEGWGGAKDGKFHNPVKALYLLTGPIGENPKASIWLSNLKMQTASPKVVISKEVRLDEFLREGELDWKFHDGREFKGAKGSMDIVKDETGAYAVKMLGDFTGGGAYVSGQVALRDMNVKSVTMQIKTKNVTRYSVRMGDGSGQTHQRPRYTLNPNNEWQEVTFIPENIAGGEHWGGANDGKWSGTGKYLALVIGKGSAADAKPEILIKNVRARVEVEASVAGKPYSESFETQSRLNGMTVRAPKGSVRIIKESPFDGEKSLRVERKEKQQTEEVSVLFNAFEADSGLWNLSGALRSDLYSPDNSFSMRLNIEFLDAAQNRVGQRTLVDQTGQQGWKKFSQEIEFPKGTVQARFTVTTHKTFGRCDVDALAAAPLESTEKEKIIDRIMLGGDVVGNLYLPEQNLEFGVEVHSLRPLSPASRKASFYTTDYWGAEQGEYQFIELVRSGMQDGKVIYKGSVKLNTQQFEIGKYYELHVQMSPEGYQDAKEYSGFSRLPVAESRQYPAEEIPFTIRNWDSRITDYFDLSSRIGLRQIGTWGGVGWEKIVANGDTWYGGPRGVNTIEKQGWEKAGISEEKLRQDAIDFMTQYKDEETLACVMLGNEPPEREDMIDEKIRAYKISYEAIKSVKPDVKIVTTSVPALESFFSREFYKYTDVYDFHIYETYRGVRSAIQRYRALGKKYGAEKPIWCTELGLNSQGQTRHAVALEVVKKITSFFAEGGANVSWFTIMYPDKNGQARGTLGNAHNTFDAQYNKYNPRLDAIMYYNMINGITVKDFVSEVHYANGVQSYLFRDAKGDAFNVLWKDGSRVDCDIALNGIQGEATLIRIDGSQCKLSARNGKVTLGISSEPVMLRYRQVVAPLAKEISKPSFTVPELNSTILKGATADIRIFGENIRASEMVAVMPPRWTAVFAQQSANEVVCTVSAPEETGARTGRVMIRRKDNSGEIILSLDIMSPVSVDVIASSRTENGDPAFRVVLNNNGNETLQLSWAVEIVDAFNMTNGVYKLNEPSASESYLKGDTEGNINLSGRAQKEAHVVISSTIPTSIYKVRVTVTDQTGRRVVRERYVAGCATAAHVRTSVVIDGAANDAVWAKAETQVIDAGVANFRFKGRDSQFQGGDLWGGIDDLSATWKAAWDDDALYLLVDVKDDVHRVQFADGHIWNQDGLQFLFDPMRTEDEKAGKYDISLGHGTKGPQAMVHLSAHSSVNTGSAQGYQIATSRLPDSPGGIRYEIAIPWNQLAPFKVAPKANLGMTMILNEDDGDGRIGFMGWFSGAHSKQLDLVGDLILGE